MFNFFSRKTTSESNLFFVSHIDEEKSYLKNSNPNQTEENAFIDADQFQGSDHYLGLNISNKTLKILLAVFFLFALMIVGKVMYLQFYLGDYYQGIAENNRIRIIPLRPARGIIFDRNGQALVKNVPNFSLVISPQDLPRDQAELQNLLNRLLEFLPDIDQGKFWDITQIKPQQKEYYELVELYDNLSYEQAIYMATQKEFFKSITYLTEGKRQYLNESLPSMSHLLGYTGKISQEELVKYGTQQYLFNDTIGKSGIELTYEAPLRGILGRKQVEIDAVGREKKIIAQQPQIPGNNVVLSIDSEVQKKAEQILSEELEKSNLKRGIFIVQDPSNGEILAMVSLPTFDDNLFANKISVEDYQKLLSDPDQPLYNRAIAGQYPSGSTIKPMIAGAALEDGLITDKTTFLSTGGIRIDQWFFPDWSAAGHGQTDVYRAIAWSVNTFFYMIGGGDYEKEVPGLGVDKINFYLAKFGFGQSTHIDLPHESQGLLPNPEWKWENKQEDWYIGDTYHLSIGQGDLLVTPLQINNAIAAYANGGTLYQPHLIKQIKTFDNSMTQDIEPKILNQDFISSKNIEIIRNAMRQTVTGGSAQSLNSLPIASAGKTGTAQWSNSKENHAWYTGFAPFEDPQIVFTILVEEGGDGDKVAVPIAKKFLQWYFTER